MSSAIPYTCCASETHQINYCLPVPLKYSVLGIHLPARQRTQQLASTLPPTSQHTSSSLNAARLFSPCTFASLANESRPCRCFQRDVDAAERACHTASNSGEYVDAPGRLDERKRRVRRAAGRGIMTQNQSPAKRRVPGPIWLRFGGRGRKER